MPSTYMEAWPVYLSYLSLNKIGCVNLFIWDGICSDATLSCLGELGFALIHILLDIFAAYA